MFRIKREILNDFEFAIVTPSQWLAKHVKQSYLENQEIYVSHNGIDTECIFYSQRFEDCFLLRKNMNKKIVLFIAPNIIDERKGGKTVLKVAENMIDLQFVLIGTDKTKKHSDNILMIKCTNDQGELARWYLMVHLFLICSDKENFPITCLEALSYGTPIIGIDAGGTKETAPTPYGVFAWGCNGKA